MFILVMFNVIDCLKCIEGVNNLSGSDERDC